METKIILLTVLLLAVFVPSDAQASGNATSSLLAFHGTEAIGPGKQSCPAYGRKHLRRGKCGGRNRRVERFLRGYTW